MTRPTAPALPLAKVARALPGGREDGLAGRLARLTLSTSATALLVAGSLLNGAAHLLERQALLQAATVQAQVMATNVAAALLFGDADTAQEVLGSLRSAPDIRLARLLDPQGRLFAQYQRDADAPARRQTAAVHADLGAPADAGLQQHTSWSLLTVAAPVMQQRRRLGQLVLELPLGPLYQRTALFAGITLAAALLAMLLSHRMARGVRRDVDRIEQEMLALAFVDPVSGLDNRNAVRLDLAGYVARADAGPAGQGFSVVSLDLDNFKTINDTLGHHVGDQVLHEVALRLGRALQPGAKAYRLGGDEFVVVCPCAIGYRDPARYGQMVRQALSGSLHLAGVDVMLGGSVGVARYPLDGASAEAVLLASDIAMYRSKAQGKHQVTVFDASLREASELRLRLEMELRLALAQHELRLVYQPLLTPDGRIVAAEALVRWQHPQRGFISPAEFIPVAESSGLIVELGAWVLGEAARQVVQWTQAGLPMVNVAVNVSPRQLRDGVLIEQYRHALQAAGCEARHLSIELTEDSLVEDIDENTQQLHAMRALGAQIAIDDFGTGQSSLSYMKRLPVDKLKIDQSFVAGLPDDRGDRAIVAAALSMAHALGLQVVAEGVETEAQRQLLCAMGVDLLQGYHFSRPVPADAFAALLRHQAAPPPAAAALVTTAA